MLHRVLCFYGALALTAGLLTLSACASSKVLTDTHAIALSQLTYPNDAEHAPDQDIEVFRVRDKLRVINRSTRTFTNVQLWLNQQWVTDIDHIDVGTGKHGGLVTANEFVLDSFVDQYRRPYPVGTLLSPDKTQQLVFAEIFVPEEGKRYRLAVRYEPQ